MSNIENHEYFMTFEIEIRCRNCTPLKIKLFELLIDVFAIRNQLVLLQRFISYLQLHFW